MSRAAREMTPSKQRIDNWLKRLSRPTARLGRSPDGLKFKNPAAPAVRREAEEVGQSERTVRL